MQINIQAHSTSHRPPLSPSRARGAGAPVGRGLCEQFPNHQHRNLRAFEDAPSKSCLFLLRYRMMSNFSGLGVRVVWKLLNLRALVAWVSRQEAGPPQPRGESLY